MYHYAKGVPSFLEQDFDTAIEWMTKASEQGSLESTLALFYLHMRAATEQDRGNEDKQAHMSAACNCLREAADKGVRVGVLISCSSTDISLTFVVYLNMIIPADARKLSPPLIL